jgi:predicted transcriptional regulator
LILYDVSVDVRLSPRPIVGSPADDGLLVELTGLEAARRNVELGLNVLVSGAPGSGKTTFLYALERILRAAGETVVYVNGTAAEDSPAALLAAVTAQLHQRRLIGDVPLGERDEEAARLAELRSVQQSLSKPVVLVDGTPSPEVAYAVFGRLRDELWAAPLVWVAAVDLETAAALHRPPADAFFSAAIWLGPLTAVQAEDLIRRRAPGLDSQQVAAVIEAGGGSPRALIRAAQKIITGETTAAELSRRVAHDRELRESLSPAAAQLLGYLTDVGPASASDEALLAEVGMSRPNVVRLLRELEEAGLVRGEVLREGHARRPRKVYRRVSA